LGPLRFPRSPFLADRRLGGRRCISADSCPLHDPLQSDRLLIPGVHLELLAERHLDAVAALLVDPDVLRFTRVPDPPPAGFEREWLGRYEDARRDGAGEAFAAVDDDGAFLGLALAPEIDEESGEVELGYIVAPQARGRGVATAILRELTDWALGQVGAQRIVLIIDVDNRASARVAERCGYTREGVMRSIHLKPGVRVDAGLWSRLPSDQAAAA
jgi:RimJ/RimL family protein N-acetyltransferase